MILQFNTRNKYSYLLRNANLLHIKSFFDLLNVYSYTYSSRYYLVVVVAMLVYI